MPIDLGLITNIFNNPLHFNESAPIPSNHVKRKTREIDLFLCYVSNPRLTIPICTTHLLPYLQFFIKTPSLSLRLRLPRQVEHRPMHPIPNLNTMVELPLGVTTRSKATNTWGEKNKKKWKFSTSPLTIIRCKCCHMIVALEIFISMRLCATRS